MPARRRHSLPAAVYALVERSPGAVLLEGAGPGETQSNEEPWTRLFTSPLRICAAYEPAQVSALFGEIESAVTAGLSAAGFFSYECGIAFESKAGMHPPRAGSPLAWFGIYEHGYIFDHELGEFVGGAPPGLDACSKNAAPASDPSFEAAFTLPESVYARHIAAIHSYIRAGDVYQLNFTAPFSVHASSGAAAVYARLRNRQPAAYGAFVHWQQGRHVLSFSPELFFRVDDEGASWRIKTRPMKGTAPRGRTTIEDRAQADWLRNDGKNRSENLMIVDLVRNDLGRVARFGTVRTENLFSVERLPTLWQMTSTVTAELREDAGIEAIFRALFPCGSITGAPKVRAMQLIGELEDQPRGVYTGTIGFFSPRQTVFNVAIRTLVLDGNQGTMGVGSGIVIDSEPAAEYRECLLKAEFLTRSVREWPQEFSLIETMLWDGGFQLLDLHLDRLLDSAEYFDYPCDRAAVKTSIEQHALGFSDERSRRVRLLVAADGGLQIADEILAAPTAGNGIFRVRIAAQRTDPADPMLFHKTTHRPLYGPVYEQASREGFADALFFNNRGELTEGAISSVFIVKDGRWSTPAVECGLLAGVYRRHLLETLPEIEERALYEEDLRSADAIYIANAIRGLRRVQLIGD